MNLGNLLKPEAVKVVTSASSKKRLLQEIAEVVQTAYGLNTNPVVEALMAREALGPTGVGHGVALPHARIMGISQARQADRLRRSRPATRGHRIRALCS